MDRGIVGRRGLAAQDPTGSKLLPESRVARIVAILRLFLRVEVLEIAEELVEAVHGRQEFVAVAEVVLAELPGRIAERLQELGNGRITCLQADRGSGYPDLGKPGTQGCLAGYER